MIKWTTRKLIAAVSLSVISLILFLPGMSLNVILGTGAGGIINIFVSALMVTLTVFILKTAGAATLVFTLYALLALPLPSLGTPGFAPKILIGLTMGLAADTVFFISQTNQKLAAFLVGAASVLANEFIYITLAQTFTLPGIEKFAKFALSPVGIGMVVVVGGVAGLVGLFIYKRLESTSVIKRIQQ